MVLQFPLLAKSTIPPFHSSISQRQTLTSCRPIKRFPATLINRETVYRLIPKTQSRRAKDRNRVTMALLPSSARFSPLSLSFPSITRGLVSPNPYHNTPNCIVFISKEEVFGHSLSSSGTLRGLLAASNICEQEPVGVHLSLPLLKECISDVELLAAVRLRIRTFYDFNESCGVEDHRRSLVEREYEALKERIAGKGIAFKRVSCINATISSSTSLKSVAESLSTCKFSDDGKDRIIVGTLDVNQCFRLTDELTGKKPEGIGADLRRAYLSNVCVAKELQRNGLGYSLVSKSKDVTRQWGVTDLYVHVAVDNDAARRLYEKSGFVYENEEPAWQARFLGRPRRLLLWADLR